MHTGALGETLLPKWLALPILCSDPLSSVAYATEQILLVLVIGAPHYWPSPQPWRWPWRRCSRVWSYRQTVNAYPNGGGAYAVSRENLGMVDYVMTVAVSVTAEMALGQPVRAESAGLPVEAQSIAGIAMVQLILRAFASRVHIAEDPTLPGLSAGTAQPTVIAQLGMADG